MGYAVLSFLFSYAIVLTASPANYNVPATSIIVYMVLFPMLVPDVAWRMLTLEGVFEAIYLFVSHTVKSHSVFLADISNSMVLVPLGLWYSWRYPTPWPGSCMIPCTSIRSKTI